MPPDELAPRAHSRGATPASASRAAREAPAGSRGTGRGHELVAVDWRVLRQPVTPTPQQEPDRPSAARPLPSAGDDSAGDDSGGRAARESVLALEALRLEEATLRADWGALSHGRRAAALAELEGRLFLLEESSNSSPSGGDPARHARSVAAGWLGRLKRSGRAHASGRLDDALRVNRSSWLAARRAESALGPMEVFVALMQVEELVLAGADVAVPPDGGGAGRQEPLEGAGQGADPTGMGADGSQDPAAGDAGTARAELRRALGAHRVSGGVSPALRTAMAGRMVDHADDAILLTGEASAAVCAWVLSEAEARAIPADQLVARGGGAVGVETLD